jgi:3-methylcrotonyl-CoA carboxylase alpha subunit
MKRNVNGAELDLPKTAATVTNLADRLAVRSQKGQSTALALRVGEDLLISYEGHVYVVSKNSKIKKGVAGASTGEIRAPMPGLIADVLVKEGEEVTKGSKILVLEAMKTHQSFTAPFHGLIGTLRAKKGDQVSEGDLLAKIEPL